MSRLTAKWFLVGLIGVSTMPKLMAGLYSSVEKCPIPIDSNGQGTELSYGSQKDGVFPQLLSELLNALDANPSRAVNPDRQKMLELIGNWKKKALPSRTITDIIGLSAAYTRVGMLDDAVALLAPRGRDRTPDFHVLANLAHVHAARGEWREALEWHLNGFDIAEFPDELLGATPAQRKWLKKVELGEYRRWLLIHRDRLASRIVPEEVDVFPLYDAKFQNDRHMYEPGQQAAAERAKLPPDAIAVVQQLILWAPWDTDLYWLLAELYAASGRLREAEVIFNQCADGRQFANRRIFMGHRAAVRDAVQKLPPEKPTEDLPFNIPPVAETPVDVRVGLPSLGSVLIAGAIFGFVTLLLIVMQIRAAIRRQRVRV